MNYQDGVKVGTSGSDSTALFDPRITEIWEHVKPESTRRGFDSFTLKAFQRNCLHRTTPSK